MSTARALPASFAARDWEWALAVLALCVACLFLIYGATAFSMVAIWRRSDTFAHGFLIVPISAYLIWSKRETIALMTPRQELLPLGLLAGLTLLWLLAHLAGTLVVEQYAFVMMLPTLVWALLGADVAKALAFPLFFLLFAVPAGDILTPALMELTADVTIFLLKASGIPVYREGLFFAIPSGRWSVVEACSGLRYLIASVTLGCLFAYLTFQSLRKRLIFMAAAVAVPIAANCLRAYLIVVIGHASDMKLATGVDHLVYGWVFFGLIIAALFWVGSRYRDPRGESTPVPAQPRMRTDARKTLAAAAAALGIAASAPAYAAYSQPHDALPLLSAPEADNGWEKIAETSNFTPRFSGSRASIEQSYRKGDLIVSLFIAYYRNQRAHGEMLSSQNVMVSSDDKVWRKLDEGRAPADFAAIATGIGSEHTRLLAWHWYWVNGTYTVDNYRAKLMQLKSELLNGRDDSAVIVVHSQEERAEAALHDFVRSVDIEEALNRARRK